jgi:hypothetical protein
MLLVWPLMTLYMLVMLTCPSSGTMEVLIDRSEAKLAFLAVVLPQAERPLMHARQVARRLPRRLSTRLTSSTTTRSSRRSSQVGQSSFVTHVYAVLHGRRTILGRIAAANGPQWLVLSDTAAVCCA